MKTAPKSRTRRAPAHPAAAATPELPRQVERELRAGLAAVTGGIAPEVYANAWWDWYLNFSREPKAQVSLAQSALQKALDNWQFAMQAASGQKLAPVEGDKRFAGPGWDVFPFNVYARAYSNWSSLMQEAVAAAPGVKPYSAKQLDFVSRQILDAASPAHYLHTNPELLEATRKESGQNLVRGFRNWLEDTTRTLAKRGPAGTEKFVVGKDVAATPGKVVMRNELVELIQYSPQTPDVYAEPVLITPAWIMKYYILDLSPQNSLVRYLVERGHTVFMISWKNPNEADRDLGMDDYVDLGLRAALDAIGAIGAIVPGRKVNTVGYCIGGTLLSIGAAVLAAEGDTRINSITMFAAQTDFSEPGELSLFISPDQLATLEAVMHRKGVLSSDQMGGAFMMLRAADLIWQPAVDSYIKGNRVAPNDLMAWNADGTRMPWRMHTEYLYTLYLENQLARGEFTLDGKKVDLAKIKAPMFVVGTETDHVAPWKSVYKTRGLTRSSDYTFLLTSGGHNAGIISGPVHPKRRHRVLTWTDTSTNLPPDQWMATAPVTQGSWWPTFADWLAKHSAADRVSPPPLGNAKAGYPALEDAPGDYVHHR